MLNLQEIQDSFDEERSEVKTFEGDKIVLELIVFKGNLLIVVKLFTI